MATHLLAAEQRVSDLETDLARTEEMLAALREESNRVGAAAAGDSGRDAGDEGGTDEGGDATARVAALKASRDRLISAMNVQAAELERAWQEHEAMSEVRSTTSLGGDEEGIGVVWLTGCVAGGASADGRGRQPGCCGNGNATKRVQPRTSPQALMASRAACAAWERSCQDQLAQLAQLKDLLAEAGAVTEAGDGPEAALAAATRRAVESEVQVRLLTAALIKSTTSAARLEGGLLPVLTGIQERLEGLATTSNPRTGTT